MPDLDISPLNPSTPASRTPEFPLPGVLKNLSRRTHVFLTIWALFLLWTGWGVLAHFPWQMIAGNIDHQYYATRPDFTPTLFEINGWACAAALLFYAIIKNPFDWLNSWRLILGCMAFTLMMGRLVGWPLSYLALMVPLDNELLLLVLAPFVMIVSGILLMGLSAGVLSMLFNVLISTPMEILKNIAGFHQELIEYRANANSLASYVFQAIYWLQNKPLPDPPPDESKGARLATLQETAAAWQMEAPESMAFGHIGGWPYTLKTDKHVLIMASTRSGKGVTIIIPHLLRYPGSAFVLDPKGENAKATGRQRAALNDTVHYLDPFGISGKPQSRFNPLSRFTPDNMEAESKALATAFFIVNERERDHWSTSAQQLLASIILYVYVSPDIPAGKKDMPTVRRLLLGGLDMTLQAMTNIDDADGLLRDLAISFIKTPEKEFGSIVSHAQRQTEILDNPQLIACLRASGPGPEVDFKAWHTGTMSVFLCLSAPKFPTFNRWLRLVLTSALDEMTDTLNPPPLPVCFMLDELATLGHLTTVENAVGLAAGYGIQLVSVFQDIAQMRDLYKTRWASFIGNSGVRALFNLDDYDTASYWSKFIGGTVTESYSRQENAYGQSSGQNVGETMRPLFSPDKIMMDFATGKMLVLAQGVRPIITDRIAYFADHSLVGTWDDPRPHGEASGTTILPPGQPPIFPDGPDSGRGQGSGPGPGPQPGPASPAGPGRASSPEAAREPAPDLGSKTVADDFKDIFGERRAPAQPDQAAPASRAPEPGKPADTPKPDIGPNTGKEPFEGYSAAVKGRPSFYQQDIKPKPDKTKSDDYERD